MKSWRGVENQVRVIFITFYVAFVGFTFAHKKKLAWVEKVYKSIFQSDNEKQKLKLLHKSRFIFSSRNAWELQFSGVKSDAIARLKSHMKN
jgi:hypothetical protein